MAKNHTQKKNKNRWNLMDKSLDLLFNYPLIQVSTLGEDVLYNGNIFIHNRDYNVSIKKSTTNQYELIHLNTDAEVITDIRKALEQENYCDIVTVLNRIRSELSLKQSGKSVQNFSKVYLKILQEYSEFTKFFLNLHTCKLKEDLSEITVSILDEKSRQHCVEINVDYAQDTTDIFSLKNYDLPRNNQDKFKPNDSLTALFDEFVAQVEFLQPYFDIMDEFDRCCTILDPDKPKKKDCYRRIFLGDNISCIITVDPWNVFLRPDLKFLGSTKQVEDCNAKLNENIFSWACENGIFQGVLHLLGFERFPKQDCPQFPSTMLVDFGECCICFSLRLNGKLPEIICKNKCCEKFYHNQCLYDWLTAINGKRVFNNITGNCPNCEKTISCPVID